MKNVRYYWDVGIDDCIVRMSNSSYVYGYEYLGASPRLVITPLTVRSYTYTHVHVLHGPHAHASEINFELVCCGIRYMCTCSLFTCMEKQMLHVPLIKVIMV